MKSSLGSVHVKELFWPHRKVVRRTSSTQDVTGPRRVVHAGFNQRLLDMHKNDFAQRQPGRDLLAVHTLKLGDLGDFALKRDRALPYPRGLHTLGCQWCEACQLKLVDVGWYRFILRQAQP